MSDQRMNLSKQNDEGNSEGNVDQQPQVIDLSDEDKQKIYKFQQKATEEERNIILQLGRLEYQRIQKEMQLENIEEQKKNAKDRFQELQNEEQQLANSLADKYGNGQIDLQEGKFYPADESNG